ncbi:hypothetical protein A0J61_03881 [Choanephora cucurbitarum]|uniref:Uncharacterized protein n=1 Tax=Choanephora cucurbitarum TaxID=101091 RepID=A0A1C7NLA1_9FUNG|nr:hypothetical protein A0J61_03881 [Choanephora cucurbitarum]
MMHLDLHNNNLSHALDQPALILLDRVDEPGGRLLCSSPVLTFGLGWEGPWHQSARYPTDRAHHRCA